MMTIMSRRLRGVGLASRIGMLLCSATEAALASAPMTSSRGALLALTARDVTANSGMRREHGASRADSRLGQELFTQRCAACHGQDGRGGMGPDLRSLSSRKHPALRAIIEQGRKTKGMPSYKGQFSEAEWRALLHHITQLKSSPP
jgi:mono/diheme cytochrome c family protein